MSDQPDDELDAMFEQNDEKRKPGGFFDDLAKEFNVDDVGAGKRSPYAPPDSAAKHETLIEDSQPNIPPPPSDRTVVHQALPDHDSHATVHEASRLAEGFCQYCRASLGDFRGVTYCEFCDTPLVPGANFCYHCGKSVEPIPVLTLRLVSTGEAFALSSKQEVYTIGRSVPQQNNFVDIDLGPLGQRKVSRQHARILLRDRAWFLEDQNSKGGTFIFNQQLKAHTPTMLEDGMVIYFSDIQFKVEIN